MSDCSVVVIDLDFVTMTPEILIDFHFTTIRPISTRKQAVTNRMIVCGSRTVIHRSWNYICRMIYDHRGHIDRSRIHVRISLRRVRIIVMFVTS